MPAPQSLFRKRPLGDCSLISNGTSQCPVKEGEKLKDVSKSSCSWSHAWTQLYTWGACLNRYPSPILFIWVYHTYLGLPSSKCLYGSLVEKYLPIQPQKDFEDLKACKSVTVHGNLIAGLPLIVSCFGSFWKLFQICRSLTLPWHHPQWIVNGWIKNDWYQHQLQSFCPGENISQASAKERPHPVLNLILFCICSLSS